MRPRYLFLSRVGDAKGEAHEIAIRVREILPERRDSGTQTLLTSPGCPVIDMPAVSGWLVGRLFTADGASRRDTLASPQQLAIMSSRGASLIREMSGSYVAFWRDCGPGHLTGLRDPSASLPAFRVITDTMVAVAFDIELLQLAGILRLQLNVAGVAGHLRFPIVPDAMTCLMDVTELRPGFRTSLMGESPDEALWIPRRFLRSTDRDIGSIASAIDKVVAGQAALYEHVAVELSGGLDSSIVAAALAEVSNAPASAVHMVPAAADGDERRYARLVVDAFRMPLREVPIGFEDVDVLARPTRLTARPTGVAYFGALDRKLSVGQDAEGAQALFSGAGGDSVFCALGSTAPILDAWRDGGARLAIETLRNVAEVADASLWTTSRHLLRRLATRSVRRWSWPPQDDLLGPAGTAAKAPDASLVADLRPGSRAHVAAVLRLQNVLDVYPRMATRNIVFPLMAQPVLEACFALPSWRWLKGGRNRAAAREAFAGRVPDAILHRKGKGRYDTLIVAAYERGRGAIREMLLGGWLAHEALIDRRAVAEALDRPVTNASVFYARIIDLVDAELWCRMILDRHRETRPR